MTAKYDHLRINVDELIPTFDDMRKYYELLKGMTNNLPYFINDGYGTQAKISKLVEELAGFITYKAIQIAKENINLEELENEVFKRYKL